MNMNYYIEFEKFMDAMADINDIDPEAISKSLGGLCGILRISKVTTILYDSLKHEAQNKGESLICYDNTLSSEEVCSERIITEGMNVAQIYIYRDKSGEAWNDEEKAKIKLFQKMLVTLLGRIRLLRIAEKYTFYDDDGYHNLRFYIKYLDRAALNGRLSKRAALHFNLKHFAAINHQIGRGAGSFVMRSFIEQLKNIVGNDGVVCRIGGDNFAAVTDVGSLDKVIEYLSGTRIVYDNTSGARVTVSASIGVFIIPENFRYNEAADIMDKIISASQAARNSGKLNAVFFDDNMIANKEKATLIQELFPQALEDEEFLVYYQPKVAVGGGTLAGAEALCRWMHNGELISPADFIPVLEQGIEVCKLDFYMLEHVCSDIRRWLDEGRELVRISVNLSRKHMMDSDLLERIISIVDKHNVPHKYIEIELTETTTDVEFRDLKRVVKGLQDAGIYTSVDDFGIGYSSLNLIKEIPWNVLKVDKSFLPVENDSDSSPRSVMFKYVVAMARELGLECIAEGVETSEQVNILKENSCDMAQGFYFDRPLPVSDFEERLNSYKYKSS